MVSMVRPLLIWLLVLALPAQGVAAVTMALCGPNHTGPGQVAPSHHVAWDDHAHRGGTADTLHGHDSPAVQADKVTPSTVRVAGSADFAQADTCSACAACCSAGAFLGSMPEVAAPEAGVAVFVSVVRAVDAFAADSPERPPRSDLA